MQDHPATDFQYLNSAYGDRYIYEINRNTFEFNDANTIFKRLFGDYFWQEDNLYLIIGSDSGLLVRYILSQDIPEGSRYIFIEPDYLIPLIQENIKDLELGEQISITNPDAWKQLQETYYFEDYAFIGKIRIKESLGASDAFLLDYRSLYSQVKAQYDDLIWIMRVQTGGEAFAEQQIKNLLLNRIPAIHLKNSFKNKTAIILGGGPSLDDILPWLEAHHEEVVIFAVSRIAKRLLQIGLVPHIIVSIDPHQLSFDVSREMLKFDYPVLFANVFHATHKLLAQWQGRSTYIGDLFPWRTKANQPNIPPSGGPTVTNIAINLAIEMGFEQLILGGVDLCHNKQGNSHARGSNEYQQGPRLGLVGMQVETYEGWMAETTPDFFNGIKSLEYQAKAAKEAGCTLLNASASAAKVDGIKHVNLQQLSFEKPEDDIFHIIYNALGEDTTENREQHFQMVQKELAHVYGRLEKIKKLSREALECNDGLFGRNGKTADFKYKKRMDKIEKKLDREYKDLTPMVKSFGAFDFLKMPPRDRDWTDEEIEKAGQTYYNAYLKSADRILDLIKEAQKQLDIYREEDKAVPDIKLLMQHWREQQIPGRSLVWSKHHDIPENQFDEFKNLEREFEQQLTEENTEHAKRCKTWQSLGPVRSKLSILLKQQNKEEIQKVLNGIGDNSDSEALDLVNLGQAYIAEIENDLPQALQRYSEIVNRSLETLDAEQRQANPRLEDALRHMSYITLSHDDYDNALLIMDSLAAISKKHEPQYADLLRLTGNPDKALDVYTDYLKKSPEDLVVMVKLGKLYNELGIKDSARWLFNHVAEQDPDNKAVRTLLAELNEEQT